MKGLSQRVALFIAVLTAGGAMAGFTTTPSPKSVVVLKLK
jgi:hypothetical protein